MPSFGCVLRQQVSSLSVHCKHLVDLPTRRQPDPPPNLQMQLDFGGA